MNTRSKRFVIGLTGGIASGKTEVLKELSRHGIPVLSADDLAHHCLKRGHPAYPIVQREFGTVDRSRLAAIIFKDPKKRRRLERIIHPAVIKDLKHFIRRHTGLIALDIPLLFEAHLQSLVNSIWVVSSPMSKQVRRLEHRNELSRADALRRIHSQMPMQQKIRLADTVIENSGSLTQLRTRVKRLLASLSASA